MEPQKDTRVAKRICVNLCESADEFSSLYFLRGFAASREPLRIFFFLRPLLRLFAAKNSLPSLCLFVAALSLSGCTSISNWDRATFVTLQHTTKFSFSPLPCIESTWAGVVRAPVTTGTLTVLTMPLVK